MPLENIYVLKSGRNFFIQFFIAGLACLTKYFLTSEEPLTASDLDTS